MFRVYDCGNGYWLVLDSHRRTFADCGPGRAAERKARLIAAVANRAAQTVRDQQPAIRSCSVCGETI